MLLTLRKPANIFFCGLGLFYPSSVYSVRKMHKVGERRLRVRHVRFLIIPAAQREHQDALEGLSEGFVLLKRLL